uniref:cytochrome P450 2D3-like n=1 Tax=Styela clava TaxID=7725 RepID=UPI001939C64F|nr:cytochrome P450 2D3-like [Styela clava]
MKHQEKMPYTRAFIQEIFRYRPTLPLAIAHETTSEIRIGNFKIPKNTMITPNIWAAHRDPKTFENPNKFRPERFIDENGGFIPCDDVIPFSIGNRHCIGEHIARMEVFLFFTTLLQRFKISASKDKPLPSFDEGVFSIGYSPKKFDIWYFASHIPNPIMPNNSKTACEMISSRNGAGKNGEFLVK